MRRRTAAALVLASGLALSACSSEPGSDDSAADTASATSPASSGGASDAPSASSSEQSGSSDDVPAADVKSLALTQADFPAPYTFTDLPPGALESGSDLTGGLLSKATFEPAECGSAAQLGQAGDVSQAGVAIGTDQATSTTLVSVLSPATTTIPDLAELADACSSFSFDLQGISGKARLEVLPAPSVDADQAQAARTTVTVSVGGQQQTVVTTICAASLRGVAVVAASTRAPGTEAETGADADDTAALEQLLTAGVDKVAAY